MIAKQRLPRPTSRDRRVALLAGLLIGMVGLPGCTTWPSDPTAQNAPCLPSFPNEEGWFGGDAAFSVAFDARRARPNFENLSSPTPTPPTSLSFWFFGDSFVDRTNGAESPETRLYPFIHNTVGRSTCDANGDWQIDYEWKKTQPPHAFFQPDPDASWVQRAMSESGEAPYYWPLAPFVLDDVLYVGLLRVQAAEAKGPFNLPFRLVGADLARIKNAAAPPAEWNVEITSLADQMGAIPGSAWAVEGAYVYAFAYLNREESRTPQILTRLPRSALARWPADLSSHLQTLETSGEWAQGLAPSRAKVLMEDDATEMSVHFSPSQKAWLAVYSDPTPASEKAQKGLIWLRRAQSLEGPWSPPSPLAVVPEQSSGSPLAKDPNVFCYAGKAHPQFGGPDELIVTYVCNLFARTQKEIPGTLKRLRESPGIYRPRAMRIKIPRSPVDP